MTDRDLMLSGGASRDRVLVGACAAIWLILLGVGVAAVVALTDLGRGFQESAGSAHNGLLYTIIGVSALIIVGAIPVLLRARRTAPLEVGLRRSPVPPRKSVQTAHQRGAEDLAAERRLHAAFEAALDRVWLRGTAALASALGGALVGVAAATYLMAVGKDTAAWTGYGVAGAIGLTMPVLLWVHLRHLRDLLAEYRR